MLKHILCLALLSPSLAAADIRPERPTFCGNYEADPKGGDYNIDSELRHQKAYTNDILSRVAKYACDAPDDSKRQAKLAEARNAIAANWGISPAMTMSAIGARLDLPAYRAAQDKFCTSTKRSKDATDYDNAVNAAWGRVNGCEKGVYYYWFVDEQAEISQVMRLASVLQCFEPSAIDAFETKYGVLDNLKSTRGMTAYARCGVDARKLDRTAFEAELAAHPRVTPAVKQNMLENFDQEKAWMEKVSAVYRGLAEKDPAYKEVLFDLPESIMTAWAKSYASIKADFDEVIAVERKAPLGRKAVKGCSAKLREGYARYLASGDSTEAIGSRFRAALAFCEGADGNAVVASCLADGSKSGARGPRTQALAQSMVRILNEQKDDAKFGDNSGAFWNLGDSDGAKAFGGASFCERHQATIKSVKIDGETATIAFKTVTEKLPVSECENTSKVIGIDLQTGRNQYEQHCVDKGWETKSTTEEPVEVPAYYTKGLKAGQFLVFGAAEGKGFPIEAYADSKKQKLVSKYGR